MVTNRIHAMMSVFVIIGVISCASETRKSEATPASRLIGRWEGMDRTGKMGAFQFFEDGSIILIIDGRPLGGPDSNGLGRLRYTVDFSKDPVELDIIGIDPTGTERGKILMIIGFISSDRIKIRTYFNDIRPPNFEEESIDDTIVLDRQPD